MEIITGVERRRRWRVEEKLRIVAEVDRPGAIFAEVARRHGLSRGLLWQWRDQVRRGLLGNDPVPVFAPVHVIGEVAASTADTAATRFPCRSRRRAGPSRAAAGSRSRCPTVR